MAQFTKKAIMETFMELLEEKPLDKITVKDVVERCDINRGTFYYYYTDIFELAEDIFETELQQITSQHRSYDSWQQAFLEATQLAQQSKRQIFHVLHTRNREKLEQDLYRLADHMMRDFVDLQAQGLSVPEENCAFIARFYSAALVGMTLRWLADGMKGDPEQDINRMGLLFDGNIRAMLERAAQRTADKTAP